MWDSNTPLQLLNSMPNVLENEHLEKLQMLLEADKYKNQLISGMDMCGNYAPFCNDCNKENKYPCAVAYVNFLKAQGMDFRIASEDNKNEEEDNSAKQQPVTEADEEVKFEEKPEKTKIRIAIARKKTLL